MNLWQLIKWSFYIDLYAVPALLVCFLVIEPGVFPWVYRVAMRFQRRQILRLEDRRRLRLHKTNNGNQAAMLPPEIQLVIFHHLRSSFVYPPLAEMVVQHWNRTHVHPKQNAIPRYTQDLRSCALTCRAWSEAATEILGRHLALRSHRDVEDWRAKATSTRARQQLARVRKLELPNCHYDWIPLAQQMWREGERKFTKLHSMTAGSKWFPDPWRARYLSQTIPIDTIQHLLRTCISLTALTLWAYDAESLQLSLFALDGAAPDTLVELDIRIPHEARHGDLSTLTVLRQISFSRAAWTGKLQKLALDGVSRQTGVFEASDWTNLRELSIRNSHISLSELNGFLREMPALKCISLVNVKIFDIGPHWHTIDYSTLFSPVADTLEELTLLSVICITSPTSSPIWTTGLPLLRSVTVDTTFLYISPTQTEPISPPWVESLTFVMRPRTRTEPAALLKEVIRLVSRFAIAACTAAPQSLRKIEVWDYIASETEHYSLAAAEILRWKVSHVSPEASIKHHFVKLPYVWSILSAWAKNAIIDNPVDSQRASSLTSASPQRLRRCGRRSNLSSR